VAAWLFGRLPGGFAIPEGLGDALAAAGALALLPSLRRGTVSRTWLLAWNTFGLADLLSALIVGVLYSNGPLGVLSRGGVTTELMVTFPVSLWREPAHSSRIGSPRRTAASSRPQVSSV
jgi:hypothetical protein